LSGTLRSTLDVFDEYEDAEVVGVRPVDDCVVLKNSSSLRHFAVSTLSQVRRKQTQLLRLMPIFSVTSILPYLRVGITSLPGQSDSRFFLENFTDAFIQGEAAALHGSGHFEEIQGLVYG